MEGNRTEGFRDGIRADSLSGKEGINAEDALAVLRLPRAGIWSLLKISEEVCSRFKGDQIRRCSTGNCRTASGRPAEASLRTIEDLGFGVRPL